MKQAKQSETEIRVLKNGMTQSISGKSNIVYEVGVDEKKGVHMRVVNNSGRGMWNRDWVALRDIDAALGKAPQGEFVTSNVLLPLLKNVSSNTTGFLWAALIHEGFVVRVDPKTRGYQRVEPKRFREDVQALMDGKAIPKVKARKSPVDATDGKASGATKKKK